MTENNGNFPESAKWPAAYMAFRLLRLKWQHKYIWMKKSIVILYVE